MSEAFKKKKSEEKVNFLLGSQLSGEVRLERALIIKSAMFWDSKNRIEKIKSLMLSNLGLEEFDDVQDFKIRELTSIRQLSLSKNRLLHLQPIAPLETLLTLNINHNRVYNLAPLESLLNLEELYASTNHITNISPLRSLPSLRVLHLYSNRIANLDDSCATLQALSGLEDLDVEENPFSSAEQTRRLLQALPLTRLNNKLVQKGQKEALSSGRNLSSSCVIKSLNMQPENGLNQTVQSCLSLNSVGNKVRGMQQRLLELQEEYGRMDDQFEEEIIRNVHLKSQVRESSKRVKVSREQKEEQELKEQEIQQMKRKAKGLKEKFFTKDAKGTLLRRLFQLETQTFSKPTPKPKGAEWSRRFDSDEVIIIETDSQYLQEEKQIQQLLTSNDGHIQQLRNQIKSLY